MVMLTCAMTAGWLRLEDLQRGVRCSDETWGFPSQVWSGTGILDVQNFRMMFISRFHFLFPFLCIHKSQVYDVDL